MATFLTGNKLNSEIENLIEKAESLIVIISPYIKLHERYTSALKTKLKRDDIKLIIVFGKNEDDMSKSMIEEDFNFFKEFPNVHIYYEKRLHAKYIANESASILTSMNFHKFSQDNNIEAGVMTETSRIGEIAMKLWDGQSSFESQAWDYFSRVIEQADLLFRNEPEYENGFLGLSKKYKSSKITTDKLSDFFNSKKSLANKNSNTEKNPVQKNNEFGYCIRTGKEIPFDVSNPMCPEAFDSWSKFWNPDYKENFCHFSGEDSLGETTFSKPILRKNWKKAKEANWIDS